MYITVLLLHPAHGYALLPLKAEKAARVCRQSRVENFTKMPPDLT